MLQRIDDLLKKDHDFAFETTLSTRSFTVFVEKAKASGFTVSLLFFWLSSVELAKSRVAQRVSEGGHHIPEEVIERRYRRGLQNLFDLYLPICDQTLFFDNSEQKPNLIFKKWRNVPIEIYDRKLFNQIMK